MNLKLPGRKGLLNRGSEAGLRGREALRAWRSAALRDRRRPQPAAVPRRGGGSGGERTHLGFPEALERYFKGGEETLRGADPLMSLY